MKAGDFMLIIGAAYVAWLLFNAAETRDIISERVSAPQTTGSSGETSLDDCDGTKYRNSRGHVCGPIDVFGFRKRGW